MQHYNTNSSTLSLDYKIAYEQPSTIVEHLEESQEELNFLKFKLTEVYEKLQNQMKANCQLEDENQYLKRHVSSLEETLGSAKKQNNKLKETLDVVLQNRAFLQQTNIQLQKANRNLQQASHDLKKANQSLKQKAQLSSKAHRDEIQQLKVLQTKQLREALRENDKRVQIQRKSLLIEEYTSKIDCLEREIRKITQQKVTEVKRLRHELDCFRVKEQTPIKDNQSSEGFSLKTKEKGSRSKSPALRGENNENINHQNVREQSRHTRHFQQQRAEKTVGKWRKASTQPSKSQANSNVEEKKSATDDEALTKCQLRRKKVEFELSRLQKIRRPTAIQREKIDELEKVLYQIDSEIAGLKRLIRRKY